MNTNKLPLFVVVGLAAAAAHAQSYSIDFDALNPGDAANLAAPAAIRFDEATWSPSYNADGDVIPGSEHWQINDSASPITVQDPGYYGRGPAPSGLLALDGVFQPTLLTFGSRVALTEFSVTLDNDSYGDAAARIEFYRTSASGNTLLGWIPADQTQPGYTAQLAGTLADVDAVLLPAGALYDNFKVQVVPEPGTVAMVCVGSAALIGSAWRRRCRK